MKRILLIINMLLGVVVTVNAQNYVVDNVAVDGAQMGRKGKAFSVDMNLDLSTLHVASNHAVLLTPRIVNGTDSIELPSIGIYGRQRYYYYVRGNESMLTGKDEASFRAKECPETHSYKQRLAYRSWMDGAKLYLHRQDYGCCNTILKEQDGYLTDYVPYAPVMIYMRPEAERVKSRSLEGSAFIDFVVNKTDIRPEYRRNTVELAKIRATIDSVRLDSDISITSVWLKGFASPESPYSHNTMLAKGRTAALKEYIQQLYKFDENLIQTAYEPEDWEGLRRFVEASDLQHRSEILAMIDSDLEPDAKEWKIKKTYPEEYRFMLKEYYPALRHTDYRIAYTIRTYSDIEEIKRVLAREPQKLSLNEFYLVAQTYESGSPEFKEVFETAVRMFPTDEVANLNAANIALQGKDFADAERYLAKAGDSPQAIYARAVHSYLKEDYASAEQYFLQAKTAGIAEAEAGLEAISKMKE